jgi:hypothetical protein
VGLELVLCYHWRKLLGTLTLDEVRQFTATHASALFIFDGVDGGLRAADEAGKQWLKSLVSGRVKSLHRVLLCGRADDAQPAGCR